MYMPGKRKGPFMLMLLMVLLIGLLTFSCYKDYGMETKDYDLVSAFYDNTADFTAFKTFMMPDSIHHIVEEGKDDEISRKFDRMILDQISVNMRTLGYTEIEEPSENNKPDIVMVVMVTTTDNYYTYPVWPPYYPYYPGGGWYYPWYPAYGVSSYSTGTVLTSMVDLEQYDPEEESYLGVWIGAVNGLLGDSDANISNRLTTAINEMFRISPYLGAE